MTKISQIKIAPSVLAADFANLQQEMQKLDGAGADYIHIDIMDGNFVPNLTFGVPIVKSIRPYTNKVFDVHLMVNHPETYIDDFVEAKADIITFHYEATNHHDRLISYIKSKGCRAGIAINPSTPESVLQYLYNSVDLILVMTVNPGFGGQKFLASNLDKIANISKAIKLSGRDIDLEVDGGITDTTATLVKNAGANVLVAGSYIFSGDYKVNITKLR